MNDNRPSQPTSVEDYTNAFLTVFGVLIFLVLFAVWAVWGLLFAGLCGWIADRLMNVDLRRTGR